MKKDTVWMTFNICGAIFMSGGYDFAGICFFFLAFLFGILSIVYD